MVKLRPDKQNLEAGFTASITIFKNMGLYPGDSFKNREGVELIVKGKEGSNEWYIESVDD
ncbi:MAG: hypothetical protein KGY76_03715 [Candidatus Thermoplasmatota archaeon]|nr:hypothetical protein [Candidatus Thermoplasmatota archaeon]